MHLRLFVISGSISALLLGGASLGASAAPRSTAFTSRAPIPRTQFRVIVHGTHRLASQPAFARGQLSATAYAGAVTTVPAILSSPIDITYNSRDGKLYVLDDNRLDGTHRILKVNANGATSIFAMLPNQGNGIVYDYKNRTFYVTSSSPAALYSVSSTGAVNLLAGGQNVGHNDGAGSAASFTYPSGITVDTSDNALYLTDLDRIRRVTTGGTVTTLTAPGSIGNSNIPFGYSKTGIVWDERRKSFFVADNAADVIRRASTAGAVTVVAGECIPSQQPSCSPLQRDGHGTDALFAGPAGISVDPATDLLYVSDSGNNSIRRIDARYTVSTLAGNGLQHNVDGAGLNAEFDTPVAITISASNRLYVVDSNPSMITYALRSVTVSGTPAPPLKTPVSLYDTPTPGAMPYAIDWRATTPPSPSLWYTEQTGRIGQIRPNGTGADYFVLNQTQGNSASPLDIVLGKDGSQWFEDIAEGYMVKRTVSGQLSRYNLGFFEIRGPLGSFTGDTMATSPEGNIWFFAGGNPTHIAYYTPQGAMTQYTLPQNYNPQSMAFARDGTLWITDGNALLRLDRHGNVLASYAYPAQFLTQGSDGNIWFTQSDAIGTIKPSNGAIEIFPIYQPVPGCPSGCSRQIKQVAAGPDGAYYFTELGAIGRLTIDGTFSENTIYAAHTRSGDIVSGPDKNIWFVDSGAEKIGKLTIH